MISAMERSASRNCEMSDADFSQLRCHFPLKPWTCLASYFHQWPKLQCYRQSAKRLGPLYHTDLCIHAIFPTRVVPLQQLSYTPLHNSLEISASDSATGLRVISSFQLSLLLSCSVCVLLVQGKQFPPNSLRQLSNSCWRFPPVQLCSLSDLFLRYSHLRHHHSLCLAIHRRTIPLVGQHGIWHPPESCLSLRQHYQHMWSGHHQHIARKSVGTRRCAVTDTTLGS